MPGFTVIGYTQSQDTSGVLTLVDSMSDQHVSRSGKDVYVPAWAKNLIAVAAFGATISGCRISAPSLREESELDVSPINIGAEPIGTQCILDMHSNPRALTPSEGLRAYVSEGAAGAEQETVLIWLADAIEAAPSGQVETIKCTATQTLTANAWTLGTLTLGQQLRAGRYAIVGMRAISAGLVAARLVIPGSSYRPGCIGWDAESDPDVALFRAGRLGKWGEFEHTYVPQVEFLSISADTAETVYLDLVKMG